MADKYPRENEAGEIVWACCESSIGPVCGHRRGPDNGRFTVRVDEPEGEMGEVFCLTVLDGHRLVAGLTITDGYATLITWPDGEQNVSAELPTEAS